jgi:hypothetical protein
LVRAEGARLGLAHADAIESDASAALTDERFDVQQQRWRPQDGAPSREHEPERRPEDHREANHGASQDHREAKDHRKAEHREARDGEALHRETGRPQDDGPPSHIGTLDGEAHDTAQLDAPRLGTKEAPLARPDRRRARRKACPSC